MPVCFPDIFMILLFIIFLSPLTLRVGRWIWMSWPVLQVRFFWNIQRHLDFLTGLLKESGGTMEIKGPWPDYLDVLYTCDPANIHHVLTKNFPNYPKGSKYKRMFDLFGDGIFNSDSELWELNRRINVSLLNHTEFNGFLERAIWQKIEKGLIPILDHFMKLQIEIDLQEIFQRFSFDTICQLVLNYDPTSLSTDLPHIPCEKAFSDATEAIWHRHLVPESIWRLEKWLGIGKEEKLQKAWDAIDQFVYVRISTEIDGNDDDDDVVVNLFTAMRKACKEVSGSREFLRDTMVNLMFAGRDTTSTTLTWLFWLVATNPNVQTRIRDEIEAKFQEGKKGRSFTVNESRKLVYLHGAVCEALRLFPPIALNHKAPVQPDTLPSGHKINRTTKVILCFYPMGRMETIWGKDCLDFKPERWLSAEQGGIKREPSYKFTTFNAGPRTCPGKDMVLIQIKMVAATIIWNYNIQVVEGHPVDPSNSVVIQMKHGFKVKLSKRNA